MRAVVWRMARLISCRRCRSCCRLARHSTMRRSITCSGSSESGSCCPTSRSPTCCSGCRSSCTTARPARPKASCAPRNAGPTTGPTAYQHDQVGVIIRAERAIPMETAFNEARIFRETEPDWDGDLPIRREAIPIRLDGAEPRCVRGARQGREPGQRPHPVPTRTGVPADRGGSVGDGGRRDLSQSRRERGGGIRAARRRRRAAPRARRHDHLREPELAVGVQPTRGVRHGGRRAAARTDQRSRRRPVRRERSGRRGRGGDRRRAAGVHRGRRRGSDRAVPRDPAAAAR